MKKYLPMIVAAIIVGGIAFYGGMKYGQSTSSHAGATPTNFQRSQPGGGSGVGQRGAMGQNGGFVGGEIIAKDNTSITVKIQDARLPDGQGSSKIVFLSSSTPVLKSALGSLSDLAIGEQVTVTGSANSDGSITAQSIQIRPTPKTN